ncbi:hypothetical protein Verru16b_03374 [Lacunisphaera limnophila]|uniref:Uncharacterized protein n=1 Tax=Lacunisphaera limnophila TaxID=1838286 RepID=A0A1D8AZI5_9BACT|nr:hypothetical protein [Lacunisphaera limnophila]AOS46274.1 hypothetical protein Verru16b_03374 [Lacunisphaera limnophila]
METKHAVVDDMQVHYSFTGNNDCLIIVTAPTATGALMFCWRPEDGFRAESLWEDNRYGIGTRKDIPLSEFPIESTLAKFNQIRPPLESEDLERIMALLHQAKAVDGAH